MTTIVPPAYLSASVLARASICGTPLDFVRASGQTHEGAYCCGSQWCEYCGGVYRHRVAGCVTAAIDELRREEPHFVTLTLPRLPDELADELGGQLSEAAFRARWNAVRDCWSRATSRIRWMRSLEQRGELARAAESVPPPARPDPHPVYASTYDVKAGRWSSAGSWGYVWAREVTTGASGDHWHVHVHVVVPSRGWAERLNAAWQASLAELGYLRAGEWAHTDLRELPRDLADELADDVVSRVASYLAEGPRKITDTGRAGHVVARYASKSDVEAIGDDALAVYVAASSGVRKYDSGGRCRPLGIAREPEETDDPVQWVVTPDSQSLTPIADFYAGTAAEFLRTVRAADVSEPRAGPG